MENPCEEGDKKTSEEHALNGHKGKAHVDSEAPLILEDSQEEVSILYVLKVVLAGKGCCFVEQGCGSKMVVYTFESEVVV